MEVDLKDGIPHVRITFANGNPVLETNALSIKGMESMGAVFAEAARLTYAEWEDHWQRERERDARKAANATV